MKKLVMTLGLALCCTAMIPTTATAQTTMQEKKMEMKEGSVVMKDGKMMEMKNGAWVAMTADKTMSNGTKVMTDGTVVKKDGTKKMLENGECVKPDGMMHKMMDKKM